MAAGTRTSSNSSSQWDFTEGYSHIVLYDAELRQALLDLDAWVRTDTDPPSSSGYRVTGDNQVELAATAAQRHGVQPVATLSVAAGSECETSGEVRTTVGAGEPVAFTLAAEVPPGAGELVLVEWDFESTGTFPDDAELDERGPEVRLCETHRYDRPGTYFAVARVTSHRDGDPDDDLRLIQNLARARVIVE